MQAFIFVYLSITSRYLGPVFQCSCIPISSSKYKKDTFSLYVVMHFPFQLRSITSSCPSGAFFRYSHFWLLYGFRIGSDRSVHVCWRHAFVCILSIVSLYLVLVVSVELHIYFLIQIQEGYIFVNGAYSFSATLFCK